MLPRILSAVAFTAILAGPLFATDYLVRVETIETVTTSDAKATATEAKRSIEVVCRPGVPARSTIDIENKKLSLDALLKLTKDGAAQVALDHCFAVDTGDTYPDGDGGRKKLLDESRCKSTVTVPVGNFVDLGSLVKSDREGGVYRATNTKIL